MLTLTQAIIHSWTLKPPQYLDFAEYELLDLLIDAGFVFAYESVACQLRLHGRSPSARQDNVAQNISHSSLSLLTELLGSDPAQSTRSQTRIFGLLATMVNSRVDLPADMAREIPFSREAIDCITTTIFSYRSYYTLSELSKVLDRSDIHTPTLRSLLHCFKNFKDPLQHRFEEISGDRPSIVCIDARMEEALRLCEKIASLSYDGQSNDAQELLRRGLEKFPSLMEFHWWLQQFDEIETGIVPTQLLDPSLGCDSQESSHSVLLLQKTGLNPENLHSYLTSCVHRLERPLDQDTKQSLMRCCQILAQRMNAVEELESLAAAREKQQIIGSDFDPFFLTLLRTSIQAYWKDHASIADPIHPDGIEPSVPELIVITGLPSPLHSAADLFRRQLKQEGCMNITVADMQAVDAAILDSAYLQTGVYSYPDVIDAFTEEHISSARKFYLQNVAFGDPTGKSNIVVHINQEACRHLALLDRIFPHITVIEILPNIDHWISHCLGHIGGFNCDFTLPSMPELIAYASDYLDIMTIWRLNLKIPIYTLRAGSWLGKHANPTHLAENIQMALSTLDRRHHSVLNISTEYHWENGDDGKNLRSLMDAYMQLC